MLSHKKQQKVSQFRNKDWNTTRSNPVYDITSSDEKTNRISSGDFIGHQQCDNKSFASTIDTSQLSKLNNTSSSDTSILKYLKYQEYKSLIPYSECLTRQKIKLSNSNNFLYKSPKVDINLKKNTIVRQKRNTLTHQQSYLRNSREISFAKKDNLKGVQKPKIQISFLSKKYQMTKQQKIIPQISSYRQSRDISYNSSKNLSPYQSMSKSDNIPMFIHRKQSYAQNQDSVEKKNFTKNKFQQRSQKISLSDFEIGKCCGKGMYGKVYFARLKSNGAIFALKKISKQVLIKNNMVQQLTQQIKLQMFFNHPNILKLFHFFDDEKYVYLVMQYMEQGSLFQRMQKRKEKMNEKQTALIIIQIVSALNYLHDIDIVHRDIKPENIVISNGVHKLCDFGWSTICTNRRQTYCGTFDYAAPQILQGKQYDSKVDLWCLGILAFQLLTGKVPFYDASRKQSIRKIINSDKQAPILPNSISTKCRHFIQNLMKKRPQDRLQVENLYSHPYLALYLPKQKFFY